MTMPALPATGATWNGTGSWGEAVHNAATAVTTGRLSTGTTAAATEGAAGIVELATAAETTTGTDNTRAVHPAGLKSALLVTTTTQAGTAYTLALADGGTDIEFTAATAVTVTVPTNATVAFPVGTVITLWQETSGGQITVAGAGVTFQSRGGALKTNGQYAPLTLKKRATNTWRVTGDITT